MSRKPLDVSEEAWANRDRYQRMRVWEEKLEETCERMSSRGWHLVAMTHSMVQRGVFVCVFRMPMGPDVTKGVR